MLISSKYKAYQVRYLILAVDVMDLNYYLTIEREGWGLVECMCVRKREIMMVSIYISYTNTKIWYIF